MGWISLPHGVHHWIAWIRVKDHRDVLHCRLPLKNNLCQTGRAGQAAPPELRAVLIYATMLGTNIHTSIAMPP